MTRTRLAAALVAVLWLFAAVVHAANACAASAHDAKARASSCHDTKGPKPSESPACCREAPTIAVPSAGRVDDPVLASGALVAAPIAVLAFTSEAGPVDAPDRRIGDPPKPSRTHLRHRALLL